VTRVELWVWEVVAGKARSHGCPAPFTVTGTAFHGAEVGAKRHFPRLKYLRAERNSPEVDGARTAQSRAAKPWGGGIRAAPSTAPATEQQPVGTAQPCSRWCSASLQLLLLSRKKTKMLRVCGESWEDANQDTFPRVYARWKREV